MAFASIYVPHFMVQAVVRAEPELCGRAIALVDGVPPLWNVVAANEAALRAGIEPGMTKSQAAQFCVVIRQRSREQEDAAHAALLDLAWSVSPRVEDTASDAIVLDLEGLTSLFGSEEDIAKQLQQRASSFGLAVHVAVSANLEAALHAARGFPGITLIPPGEESRGLGTLPINVLSAPADMIQTLDRWGVRTCGALAALPLLELSERLGQEGVRLHAWARGASLRSLVLASPVLHFEEKMELEHGVAELDPLSFVLGRLLDQLCARLAARSMAASAIRVQFDLEVSEGNEIQERESRRNEAGSRGHSHATFQTYSHRKIAPGNLAPKIFQTVLTLPVPVRDSKLLLKLLRLHLQSNPPPSSVVKIVLAADPAAPRIVQRGLFLPSSPDPEKLELMLARLAHLVGDTNIGAPQLLDTHRPGEFRMSRFISRRDTFFSKIELRRKTAAVSAAAAPAMVNDRKSRTGKPASGFRIFRPAPPASVEVRQARPVRVYFRGRRGDVIVASGPWRTAGDWWLENPWQQDEWDLEIRFVTAPGSSPRSGVSRERISFGGLQNNLNNHSRNDSKIDSPCGVYRIYYDSIRKSWFVRGVYD